MKKFAPVILYGSLVVAVSLLLTGCQLFGPKKGEVSDEGSSIEVVPVTPSEEFADLNDNEVTTVNLVRPGEKEGSLKQSLDGSLRYYISEGNVLFSVAIDQSKLTLDDAQGDSSRFAVWVKGTQTAWQKVCDLIQDKGGFQCGGSLSEEQLPLEVGVVRGSGSPFVGENLLLQGQIPSSEVSSKD